MTRRPGFHTGCSAFHSRAGYCHSVSSSCSSLPTLFLLLILSSSPSCCFSSQSFPSCSSFPYFLPILLFLPSSSSCLFTSSCSHPAPSFSTSSAPPSLSSSSWSFLSSSSSFPHLLPAPPLHLPPLRPFPPPPCYSPRFPLHLLLVSFRPPALDAHRLQWIDPKISDCTSFF